MTNKNEFPLKLVLLILLIVFTCWAFNYWRKCHDCIPFSLYLFVLPIVLTLIIALYIPKFRNDGIKHFFKLCWGSKISMLLILIGVVADIVGTFWYSSLICIAETNSAEGGMIAAILAMIILGATFILSFLFIFIGTIVGTWKERKSIFKKFILAIFTIFAVILFFAASRLILSITEINMKICP